MVVDIDLGFRRIVREINSLNNVRIQVGFQEGTITEPQTKGNRVKEAGLNMAQIAAQNEFGTATIPQRSFIRTTWDENINQIESVIRSQITGIIDGTRTNNAAYATIGNVIVALIQRKIYQIRSPPNAPSTIALKGSSKPLIDFGQMVASVRYIVR